MESYVFGLIDSGYSPLPEPNDPSKPLYQGPIEKHLNLLKDGANIVQELAQAPQIKTGGLLLSGLVRLRRRV
jgi:hypothetical protein